MRSKTTMGITLLALAALVAGCSKEGPRTALDREGASVMAVDGWKRSRDLGTVVFSDQKSRATIAVRSVEFDDPKVGQRNTSAVIDSTRTVLAGLPSAKLGRSQALKRELFDGRIFDVSFIPPNKTTRYERRHAVLVGERRIYHVWLTAPQGALQRHVKLFADFLDSLREEE